MAPQAQEDYSPLPGLTQLAMQAREKLALQMGGANLQIVIAAKVLIQSRTY